MEHTPSPPSDDLIRFDTYDEFVEFAKSLFDLTHQEYKGMYKVLLKLQSIGEDPVETMHTWKKDTCGNDCPEFIRFMIQVDDTEMETLAEHA